MITAISKPELIAIGSRYRADYLAEQAGYTMGIADAEGAALTVLLPKGYLPEVKAAGEQVTNAMKDKALLQAETKDATRSQNDALRRAKIWRRKASRRALRARRMGEKIPDGLIRISQARNVPAIAGQLEAMTKLLESVLKKMPGTDTAKLLAEGKAIATVLKTADAEQEVKRLQALPNAVKEFYRLKGILYVGLKVINDAGLELYADDPAKAGKFNLSILYRKAAARKPKAEAAK
ncbi:hypothetical protein HY768_10300 [candidate division TA06 bacterium]|uniref:Uncharacterized protein n=1 Tax=candidate division TA06 bacterium TaxID=2250710 RepID=A0A933ID23_UNCT6|nr:hypothetical protein [candidate division TA06 bacterium]